MRASLLLMTGLLLAGCATDDGTGGGAGTTTTLPAAGTEATTTVTTPAVTTSTTTIPTSPTTPTTTAALSVNITGFQFQPATVNVGVAGTVEWTNLDSAPHTATAVNGSFDTGTLSQGQSSASISFPTAGRFEYRCAIHSSMRGTVIVG